MYKQKLAGLFLLTAANILNPAFAEDTIDASDGWVRAAPPNTKVMAGYLTLNNHSTEKITLVGASSPQFKSIEVHQSYTESGMMRMKEAVPLTIKGHSSVHFKPGSYHLMLIKPVKKLKIGDNVHINLEFKNNQVMTVQLPVKKSVQEKPAMHHKHEHH